MARLFFGPPRKGQECDHLCRTPLCCNPTHLEYVTHLENVQRGHGGQHNAIKTHCPKNHEYDAANTITGKTGKRFCRQCDKDRKRASYRARRDAELVRATDAEDD